MERAEWIRSGRVRTMLELGRVSNLPTVWSNVTAGWLLAGGGSSVRFVVLCIGASLLYVAGMFLNDAFDTGWDRDHRPERPIPSGRISSRTVWVIGWGLLVIGAGIVGATFVAGGRTQFLWWSLAPLIACIILYDWWHKTSAWSAVLMAGCRFFLVVTACAAAVSADSEFGLVFVGWFYAWWLAIYVLMITLVARGEAHGGELSAFASAAMPVLAVIVLISTATLTNSNFARWCLGIAFAVFYVGWLMRGFQIRRTCPAPDGIGRLVSHLLAGIVAFDCMAVAIIDVAAAFFVLALLPFTLWLQRFVPAT